MNILEVKNVSKSFDSKKIIDAAILITNLMLGEKDKIY